KAIRTLVVLVERRGRLVTKDELMKEVWPDTFVEEANVTQHVSVLRKTLSDATGDGRQWIETFPKRGYRFVGLVDVASDGASAPAIAPAESSTPGDAARRQFSRIAAIGVLAIAGIVVAIGLAYVFSGMRQGIASAELAVLPLRVFASTPGEPSHLGVGIADAIVTRLANVES